MGKDVEIERTNQRKFFSVVVENRDAATLLPLIRKYIRPGSIKYSDKWAAYRSIPEMEGCDFGYQSVNHSEYFKDPETGVHTKMIPIKALFASRLHKIKGVRALKKSF